MLFSFLYLVLDIAFFAISKPRPHPQTNIVDVMAAYDNPSGEESQQTPSPRQQST
jgi:hypothetical protein